MELDMQEVLRYLGVRGTAPEELRRQVETVAAGLAAAITPRHVYRVFPLEREEGGWRLVGTELLLSGASAELMLRECTHAALLGCTLGARFDAMLRREQARDMSRAVILDACGGALVEAGCDAAERELAGRLPGKFLTDRFSPGYGDLPLALQRDLCGALDLPRRLGVHVTGSMMLEPVKSVSAVIGISDTPRPARIRGCAVCSMRERCAFRGQGGCTVKV